MYIFLGMFSVAHEERNYHFDSVFFISNIEQISIYFGIYQTQ